MNTQLEMIQGFEISVPKNIMLTPQEIEQLRSMKSDIFFAISRNEVLL